MKLPPAKEPSSRMVDARWGIKEIAKLEYLEQKVMLESRTYQQTFFQHKLFSHFDGLLTWNLEESNSGSR